MRGILLIHLLDSEIKKLISITEMLKCLQVTLLASSVHAIELEAGAETEISALLSTEVEAEA